MDLRILMIDDDEKITKIVKKEFDGRSIGEHKIFLTTINDFEEGKKKLESFDYDILILDIFKGKPSDSNPNRDGEKVLEYIKKTSFVPIIFFSGLPKYVSGLETDIIRVVEKTIGGNEALLKEIEYIIGTNLPLIKKRLNSHIKESMRMYFWDFVQTDWSNLSKIKDDISLGYLITRRIAKSFSKERIKEILKDKKISDEKIYPMEFYIYPPMNEHPETGDIVEKDRNYFIIITPTCDIIQNKTDTVHLAECIPLKKTKEYSDYKNNKKQHKDQLGRLIKSTLRDRHFFLPKTHFIDNSVVDFHKISTVSLKDIIDVKKFRRIAKLDDPFAQSMIGSFIRYFNRIGTPDIDSDYIIKHLD